MLLFMHARSWLFISPSTLTCCLQVYHLFLSLAVLACIYFVFVNNYESSNNRGSSSTATYHYEQPRAASPTPIYHPIQPLKPFVPPIYYPVQPNVPTQPQRPAPAQHATPPPTMPRRSQSPLLNFGNVFDKPIGQKEPKSMTLTELQEELR